MEPDLEIIGGIRNQLIAVIVSNILIFNQGSIVGWVSPALPILTAEDSPLGKPLTEMETSMIASSFCVGAIFGTPFYGWLADKFGRKRSLLSTSLLFLICWSLKLCWLSPMAMIVARFMVGIGSAGALVIVPLYSSEIASVEARGVLGVCLTFSFNIGVVFMYVIGAYLGYFVNLVILITFPVIFLIFMSQMPDTPSDLVKRKKYKEAAKALAWLRRAPADSTLVKNELEQLIHESKSSAGKDDSNTDGACDKRQENVSSWKFLLNSPPSLKALSLTSTLLTIQCFIGMFAVLSYANTIFKEAGSTLSPNVSSIIIGVLQLVGSCVASSLIERLGRKILLIASCSTVVFSMASLGTFFYVRDSGYDVSSIGWLPVVALSTALCTYSMGIGPVPFILPSEVFVVQVRGLCTSIGLTCMWISTFIIAQFYPLFVATFGSHVVFWFFALDGCLAILIAVLFVPETKGRTIEETVAYFGGKKFDKPGLKKEEELGELLQNVKLRINGVDEHGDSDKH